MLNQEWKERLPDEFPDASRVWIYQSSRPFTEKEEAYIRGELDHYVDNWVSHSRPVKGWATVLFKQFILIMSDDTEDRLCGSAIDDSFRFIKYLDEKLELKLLDRMQMGFVNGNEIQIIPMEEIEKALAEKRINEHTLFFNNGIATRKELLNGWIIPLKKSFLWQRFAMN